MKFLQIIKNQLKLFFSYQNSSIKRKFLVLRMRLNRMFSHNQIPKMPSVISDSARTASAIFTIILRDPGTKLYYDIQTGECYLHSEDETMFIFLESRNIKVINSVYGYDVPISYEHECFLTDKFRKEMAVRRLAFKKEALSKVQHSLGKTLERLKENQNK